MKTSTPKKRHKTSTQPQSAAPSIPKDLSDKWGAVEAISTAFQVIKNGMFGYNWLEASQKSLGFLAALHEQALTDAKNHPDAKLIPELKELLETDTKTPEDTPTQELQAVQ